MNYTKPKKAQEPEPDPKPVQREPRVIITEGAQNPGGEYVLIGYPAVAVGNRVITYGQRVSAAEWQTFPQFIRERFWKIGAEIPANRLAKLSPEMQKLFKPK